MKKTVKQIESSLNDLVKQQCLNGTWNYSEYMWGMANGLIVARSVVDGKDPVFMEKPKKWLGKKWFQFWK